MLKQCCPFAAFGLCPLASRSVQDLPVAAVPSGAGGCDAARRILHGSFSGSSFASDPEMRLLQHVAARIVSRRGLAAGGSRWANGACVVGTARKPGTPSMWREMAARGRRAWAVPAVVPLAVICYMQPSVVRCDAGQSLLAAIRSGDRAAVVAALGVLVRQLDRDGFESFATAGGLQQLAGELSSPDVGRKVNALKALRALASHGMIPFVERSNLVAALVACTGTTSSFPTTAVVYKGTLVQ
jgi:hypothetical protein